MVKRNDKSWLKRTNQQWKYSFSIRLMLIGALVIALKVFGVIGHEYDVPLVILVLLALSMPLLFIQCPSCGKRPFYKIIRESGPAGFIRKFITFELCPDCRYPGGQEPKYRRVSTK